MSKDPLTIETPGPGDNVGAEELPKLNDDCRIVIMGPAGSGKTTVGQQLATRWDRPFEDADDHHSAKNIEKMRAGMSLTDDDRGPWLARLNRLLKDQPKLVLACSALKQSYRTALAENTNVLFVLLDVPREELHRRLRTRRGHYAGDSLLESQLSTLEMPKSSEARTIVVPGVGSEEEVFRNVHDSIVAAISNTNA